MKNLPNKNRGDKTDLVQVYLESSWDIVVAVYNQLANITLLGQAIDNGTLDTFLSDEDLNTLAKLNALVADATLGDAADFATAAQGLLAENAIQGPYASQGEAEAGIRDDVPMSPLRVAQAIAVLAAGIQNQFAGMAAPTVTDDASAGYAAGSVWIDVSASPPESYRCADPTAGAAVWIKTTLTADELATIALSGSSDDLTEGSVKLLMTVAERAKLAGIEDNATADQTPAEIEQGYNSQVGQVSAGEKTAGTEAAVRRFSPLDIKDMVITHAPGGGGVPDINGWTVFLRNAATVGQPGGVAVSALQLASVPNSGWLLGEMSGELARFNVTLFSNFQTSGQYTTLTEKVTPVAADILIIEDSESSGEKKKVQLGNLPGGAAGGGGLTVEFKTADFTAEANKKYKVDTTGGQVTVTLPAGTNLDNIVVQDVGHYARYNNIVIIPNGSETIDNDTGWIIDQNDGDVDIAYNAANTNWEVSADGTPEIVYQNSVYSVLFKSANYTAVAGDKVYADCSGGAVTITLPASPTTGDEIIVLDSSGDAATNNVTVARNGKTIDGAAADFVIDLNYGSCAFAYDGTGWKIDPYAVVEPTNYDSTKYVGVNDQTGTTYTLAISDAGKLVTMDNAAANTLTIPANSSVAFDVGTRIDVLQKGAGQTTVAITTDTLNAAGGTKINAQYEVVSLIKIAATTWVVVGGVA